MMGKYKKEIKIIHKDGMEIECEDRKIVLQKLVAIFERVFRVVCVVCAIALCIYCITDYMQNEDLTEVSFVKFEGNETNRYPEMSLCFSDQFSESELKKINKNFSTSAYHEFLWGRVWDPRMVDLEYEKIATKPENYLLHSCAQSTYGGRCDIKVDVSSHVYFWGTQCLTLHTSPTNRMFEASMWINSSVFVNGGARPQFDYKFTVSLSYPKQLLRFAYHFGHWPARTSTDKFSVNFNIKDVEIVRRRNKPQRHCSYWKNYDTIVEEQALSFAGCRLFNPKSISNYYSPLLAKYPACDSKEKVKIISRLVRDDIISDSGNLITFAPPCSEIKRMNVEHQEENTDAAREQVWVPSTKGKLNDNHGWFRVRIKLITNEFKEFKQLRAYNSQSLVGNSGGYIGLLVGYTIAEIPRLFAAMFQGLFKKSFFKSGF